MLEKLGNAGSISSTVAGEGNGRDGGEHTGEAGDAVGDAGDLAAKGNGNDNGVKGSAVVADVEVAWGAGGWGRRRVATDAETDAEELVGEADDSLWEGEIEVDTDQGKDKAEGDPYEGDESIQGGGALDEAPVMEDDLAFQLI